MELTREVIVESFRGPSSVYDGTFRTFAASTSS
jgi:hypothetical protein